MLLIKNKLCTRFYFHLALLIRAIINLCLKFKKNQIAFFVSLLFTLLQMSNGFSFQNGKHSASRASSRKNKSLSIQKLPADKTQVLKAQIFSKSFAQNSKLPKAKSVQDQSKKSDSLNECISEIERKLQVILKAGEDGTLPPRASRGPRRPHRCCRGRAGAAGRATDDDRGSASGDWALKWPGCALYSWPAHQSASALPLSRTRDGVSRGDRR